MPEVEASDTTRRPGSPAARNASFIRSCDSRFTAMTESHLAASMLASSLSRVMPALWITMSSFPCLDVACSMITAPASSRVMSSCRAVPETWLATFASASPAAGTSTTTTVAPSRRKRLGDRGADPARRTGHHGDLAGQRLLEVRGKYAVVGRNVQELPVDVGAAPREQETQRGKRRGGRGVDALAEHHAVGRRPAAQFAAEGTHGSVDALAGRGLGRRVGGKCRAAEGDDAPARGQLAQRVPGGEHRFGELARGGNVVEHQDDRADLAFAHGVPAHIEAPAEHGVGEPLRGRGVAKQQHGAGHQRRPGGVAAQDRGPRQAQGLGEVLGEAGVDEFKVLVGHG